MLINNFLKRALEIKMTKTPIISSTIVLYKNDVTALKKTVESFTSISLPKVLYLVDNSPTNALQNEFIHPEIEYIFIGKNIWDPQDFTGKIYFFKNLGGPKTKF